MRSYWQNPKIRSQILQVLILAAVGLVLLLVAKNTVHNLQSQGIASGFGFLETEAGFDIIMHLIPYSEQSSYGTAFVVALLNTLLVSILGVFLATVLGFVVGVARLSHNFLIAKIAAVYVEIIRNVPLLLQLFFWYFAVLRTLPSPRQSLAVGDLFFLNIRGLYVPDVTFTAGINGTVIALTVVVVGAVVYGMWARRQRIRIGTQKPYWSVVLPAVVLVPLGVFLLSGVPVVVEKPVLQGFNFQGGISLIPEFVALLLALSLYTAAFIAEIVRAGILAVAKGQVEAAQSLGLTRGQTLRLVVIPQAMRVIIPPL